MAQIIDKFGEAQRIFSRSKVLHDFYPPEYLDLLVNLLAAKMNFKLAAARNEPLAEATIMGTELTVAQLTNSSDDLIASISTRKCMGNSGLCRIYPTAAQLELAETYSKYLDLVNQGMVYFYAP